MRCQSARSSRVLKTSTLPSHHLKPPLAPLRLSPYTSSAPYTSAAPSASSSSSSASSSSSSSSSYPLSQLPYRATLSLPRDASVSHGAATLSNRHLHVNPLHSIAAACQALLTKLDIAAAATLDKSTPVWVALTGVAAGASAMGCHLYQHFQVGGCPEFVTALCEDAFGYQLSGIGRLGVFAVAAVLALWQLRMWCSAHITAVGSMLAVSASSPDNPVASTVAFFTTATRLLLLHSAATALTGGAGVSGYLPAGMLYILSLAPLALALTKGKDLVSGGTDSATKGKDLVSEASSDFASASATTFVPPVSGAAEVAPAILGAGVTADAVFLALLATAPNGVAEAGLLPPIALAALALLQTACAAVAPLQASFRKRLSGCQAEEGDIVKVHISVAVHDTAVVLDTTHGMEPLLIKVGDARTSLGLPSHEAPAETEQAGGAGQAGEASEASEEQSRTPRSSRTFRGPWTMDILDPETANLDRFRLPLFADVLDQLVPGKFIGETGMLMVYNVPLHQGGYAAPSLTWWQPIEEFEEKFKGSMPTEGNTFWYPLGVDGGMAPVRVNAVARDFIELDGNCNVENKPMRVYVEVVGVQKK